MSNTDGSGAQQQDRVTQPLKEPPIWVAIALTVTFIGLAIFMPGLAALAILVLIVGAFILFGATYPHYGDWK